MPAITSVRRPSGADIRVVILDDAVHIRLSGQLDYQCLGELSEVLLRPRPDGRRSVVVDAGYVDAAPPAVLSILLSAADWISSTGGDLVFATLSWPLLDLVRTYGVAGDLPHLPPADSPARLGHPGRVRLPR